MPTEVEGRIAQVRPADEGKLADSEDISGGVSRDVGDVSAFTLFFDVEGAVDISVEISPDGGTNYYELPDNSPVQFGGAGTDILRVSYECNAVKLKGLNATNVTAQVREVT